MAPYHSQRSHLQAPGKPGLGGECSQVRGWRRWWESSPKANLCEEDSSQGSNTGKSEGPADRASSTGERWRLASVGWLWCNGRYGASGVNRRNNGFGTAWATLRGHGNRLGSYSWDAGCVRDDRDAGRTSSWRSHRSRRRSRIWWRGSVLGRAHGADSSPNRNDGRVDLGRLGRAGGNSGRAARDGIIRGRVDRGSRVWRDAGGIDIGRC